MRCTRSIRAFLTGSIRDVEQKTKRRSSTGQAPTTTIPANRGERTSVRTPATSPAPVTTSTPPAPAEPQKGSASPLHQQSCEDNSSLLDRAIAHCIIMSQSIPKDWIKHLRRNNYEYWQGINFFMDFAMKHSPPGLTTCSCPCKRCKNKKRASFEIVKDHLIRFGMLPTYDVWFHHGEKSGMDLTNAFKHQFIEEDEIHDEILGEYTNDNGGVLGNLVDDAYGVHNEAPSGGGSGEANNAQTYLAMPNIFFAPCLDHGDRYNEHKRIASEKLYIRVYKDLEEEKLGERGTRSEAWKRAHINKATGKVHSCVREKYNEIASAEKRQKLKASASDHDSVTCIEDFKTDPITETFEPDTKSRCRAISSISSAKQIKIEHDAMSMARQNMGNRDVLHRLEKLENLMLDVYTYLKSTQHDQNSFSGCGTPRTEKSSNSVHIPIISQNLSSVFDNLASPDAPKNNNGPTPREKQKVILLGRKREEVAKGVITPHTICHGRVVQDGEKIVWVDEVLKPKAPIYDGPQNGFSNLCEIADGGFVIWGTKRIRYL